MEYEFLLFPLLAFPLLVLRLLMIERGRRIEVARVLACTGAMGGGLMAGLIGLDDFGLMVSATVMLFFFAAALVAAWSGRPRKNVVRSEGGGVPRERHDYTTTEEEGGDGLH